MEQPSFLRLLLDEGDAEALNRPLESAREAGASEEVLERLQQETLDALQLRAVLDERRRRERELAALFETAWDLTRFRDVERVLRAIVRRARTLLQSDTAYLMLIDEERNDTYMRVSDGTISPRFRKIRLKLGEGLGGLVAQNGTPYSTSNYLADPRYKHARSVDGVVEDESLIAILGVPLKLGADVIGVLFASDRSERQFTPNDVSLLASFAAMAAVALENARLFQDEQRAVEELNRANEVIRAHSEAVERAADAHARMTALVAHGTDLPALVTSVRESLDGTLVAVDTAGDVLAHGGEPLDDLDQVIQKAGGLPEDESAAALFDAIANAGETGQSMHVRLSDPFMDRWVAPVFGGGEQLGALILGAPRALDDIDLRTLERASHVTALLMLNRRSIVEATRRARSELLEDLVSDPDVDQQRLESRAQAVGIDLSSPHCVVVASAPALHHRIALHAAGELCNQAAGICGLKLGNVVLVLSGADPNKVVDQVGDRLRRIAAPPVTIGAAGPATDPDGIRDAYASAQHCLRSLVALGREGESATPDDLGMYALLVSDANTEEIDRFVAQNLAKLALYDSENGTALFDTLATYFDVNGQARAAAERLHVHLNTLYQRLQRIGQVLEVDLSDADVRLQLHLAVRLRQLRTGT